jgi:putative endonuclease
MIFYYVYLIQSLKDSTYYIGYSDDLNQRLKEHNCGKTKSIKHKIPFKLIYFEGYLDKTTARKREIKLKKNSFEKEKLLKRLQGI